MENEKLNTKVERFIELSQQFEKSANDLFGSENDGSFGYTTGYIVMGGQAIKTRLEQVREKAEKDIKFAEDYEEYKQLQTELINYFKALNTINK